MSKLTIYDDFINNYNQINAWSDPATLPYLQIGKMALNNISLLEVSFDGTHGDENKFSQAHNEYITFLIHFLREINWNLYYYKIDGPELKSKIRSYKGLFSKNSADNHIIEEELDIDNHYSVMSGLRNITDYNDLHLLPFFNSYHCLILTSDNNFFSHKTLHDITTKMINTSYVINYIELSSYVCQKECVVIRASGDGSDRELNWHFFTKQKNIKQLQDICLQSIKEC